MIAKTSTHNNSNEEALKRLGNRIKQLRERAGYATAEEFALAHLIPPAQWLAAEAGEDLYLITIIGICKTFGITPKEFFGEGF